MQDNFSTDMMQMKKLPLCFFFIVLVTPLFSQPVPQVTAENVQDYLETGELSYTIEINFSRIYWKTAAEYRREIAAAERKWKQDRDNPALLIEYINTCDAAERQELAAEAAEKHYQVLQDAYKQGRDEISARRLLIAANQTGSRELQISAYETVRPFLELGDAEPATVYAALDNRERLEDYHLGFRIAEFYRQIYPYEAELFFRGFVMTLNNSLYRTIPFMVNAMHQQMESLESFLHEYFAAIADSVYLDLLDTAVDLEPDNYQYLLSSVGFRALVRWFTQMSTLMVEKEADFTSIQDLFNTLSLGQDETLQNNLNRALEVRPEADNQVYLAAALYHATEGSMERAAEYIDKALQVRPDLPEPYNAQIFLEMLHFIDQDTSPTVEQRENIRGIINRKIDRAGENTYDLYVLSALSFLNIRDGGGSAGRSRALSEMKTYARRSLDREENALARLSLGNAFLLQGNVKQAAEQYRLAQELSSEDLLYAPTANLGVAYFMLGNPAEAKELILKAEKLAEGAVRASALIEN